MKSKTGVYVLEDGDAAMLSRAWICSHAEKTIDIQYFIFSVDNVGLIACDYLVKAADRGVKVRILVDDIMVEAQLNDILVLDSHPNIEIKIYNPGVNLGKNIVQKIKKIGTDFINSNQRMHNKTCTVDGQLSITGGRNIADEYFDYDHEYNFRDRDVLLIGNKVGEISSSFSSFWNDKLSIPVIKLTEEKITAYKKDGRFEKLHQYACNPDNFWPQVKEKINSLPTLFKELQRTGQIVWTDSVFFVSDQPGKFRETGVFGKSNTTEKLIQLIKNAKSTIDIQSPYLITTQVGLNLFKEAVARGVQIRILTNSLASTDNLEAFSGYQKCRGDLLNAGVKIFEFKPDAAIRKKIMTGALQKKLNFTPIFGIHAKTMVIDKAITVIGTFNLDPRSAYLNTECITVIHSGKISKTVATGMDVEVQPENAWETTAESNPDLHAGTIKRLKTFTRKIVPKEIL